MTDLRTVMQDFASEMRDEAKLPAEQRLSDQAFYEALDNALEHAGLTLISFGDLACLEERAEE